MIDTVEEKLYPCLVDEKVFSIQNAMEEILITCFKVEETRCNADCSSSVSDDSVKTVQTSNTNSTDHALRRLHHLVIHSPNSNDENSLRHLQCLTNQAAQRIQRNFEKQTDKSEFYNIRYLHEKYGRRPDIMKYEDVNMSRKRPLAF